jgi:hypothetical protein
MKVILEFNLPEEILEQKVHLQAQEMHAAVAGLESAWRLQCKHGDDTVTAERACWARDQLLNAMKEHGVEIWL